MFTAPKITQVLRYGGRNSNTAEDKTVTVGVLSIYKLSEI